MDDEACAAAAFVIITAEPYSQVLKERKRPHCWVRSFLAKRPSESSYNSLVTDLQLQSGNENSVRIFEYLFNLMIPLISKRDCVGRASLSPEEMLAAIYILT